MKVQIASTLTLALAACSASAAIVIQDLGLTAPPPTIGGKTMTAFGSDARPPGNLVSDVASPLGGAVGFSPDAMHTQIGVGWATWSHGYGGDVYWTSDTSLTLTLPANSGAFSLYTMPNDFSVYNITVNSGSTSLTRAIDGNGGARGFGIYGDAGESLTSILITADQGAQGFAVGEFGIAISAVPEPSQIATGLVLLVGATGYAYRRRQAGRK